ncbi:MAG: ISAs1 family transposase [Planctomycetes bacterium]|nr:ISAs1 family transposase [Planctomycetota bacterium]
MAQAVAGRVIAIDGKTLRRAHAKDQKPLHLVSAFAAENRLVLSQQAESDKSNEITAIPELLKLLDVKKATITIDAMGCQKEIAAQIVEQKADYVLALKDNQPSLHHDVRDLLEEGFGEGLQRDETSGESDEREGTRANRDTNASFASTEQAMAPGPSGMEGPKSVRKK